MIFEYGVSIPDIHYKSYVSMRIFLCACRFLETIKFALGKMVTVHCYHQPPQPPSPFSWLPTSPPAPSGQLRVLLARRETRVKRRFVYLPPNAAPLRLMFLSDPTISYTFSQILLSQQFARNLTNFYRVRIEGRVINNFLLT